MATMRKVRKLRMKSGAQRKTPWHCHSGPMRGHTLYLATPTTLPIQYRGAVGHYDRGIWYEA